MNAVTSVSAKLRRIGGILAPRAIVFSVMDVYLVPVGRDRHELYCEVPDEPEDEAGLETADSGTHPPRGLFRRALAWPGGFFRRMRASFLSSAARTECARLC